MRNAPAGTCDQLGIEFPSVAFSHCRGVVAAVANPGGLGVLGAGARTHFPEHLEMGLSSIDGQFRRRRYDVDLLEERRSDGHPAGRIDESERRKMTTSKSGRRNVGRIDHVAFFYSTFERLEETRNRITSVLGLDEADWEKPADLDPPFNMRTQPCWSAGLEIVCPVPGHELDWFGAPLIAERGEGLGAVVFGVDDIDEASRRAERVGLPVIQRLQDSRHPDGPDSVNAGVPFFFGPEIEAPFHRIREAWITPFDSTGLAFGEFEPRDPGTVV